MVTALRSGMAPLFNRCAAFALALALAGCADDEPSGRFGELRVVPGAISMPAEPVEATTLEANGYISAVAATGSFIVAGTTTGSYYVDATTLSPLSVWSDDPAISPETGAVSLLARHGGSVLVLAAEGVFHSYGDRLVPSPASDELTALALHDIHADGDDLWLAAEEGLGLLSSTGDVSWYSISGQQGAPSAVLATDELVFVAFGAAVFEIDRSSNMSYQLPYTTGYVRAIAASADGGVYFAGTEGLFERAAGGDYTHYTMSDGASTAVEALAYYPKDGTFALTADGVVLARPGSEPVGVAPIEANESPRSLAADDLGNVWLGDGDSLSGMALGSPISFASDVAPLLETYCGHCHATGENGAPAQDYNDYAVTSALAQTIVSRISTNQMPPAGEDPVPADAFDIIQGWYLSGMNP